MFTDDEIEEYEKQLEDTSLKALLITQTAELQEIRVQLEYLNQQLSPDVRETEQYECTHCGDIVEKSERQNHAKTQHNLPTTISPNQYFERV